jgi:AraC-like DNA-binding protein
VDQIVSLNFADRDFDLTTLSDHLALSKRQVQRRMKALAGCTPSGYVRSYRLQESLEFLQKGMAVRQVAKAVGFSSQAYFASCFKAEFDQTPSDYQRRQC